MKDIEISTAAGDGVIAELDGGPRAAIRPLVRLLARHAAREDYERALEAARTKPYSTEQAGAAPKATEET